MLPLKSLGWLEELDVDVLEPGHWHEAMQLSTSLHDSLGAVARLSGER